MFGLVLEGGGCKGSYQAGACKALHELGIEFSCVAGTSVGALNGAMIVQGHFERLHDLWYDIEPSKVFKLTGDEAKRLNAPATSREKIYARLKRIRRIISDRGLDISPLAQMVSENIDEKKLKESPIDFGIVTYDISERKPVEIYKEDIPAGRLVDYLIASASFPGFQLKNIDGRLYIDGGLYNTLPVNLVKDKGYKDIIVIRTFGYGRVKKIDTAGLNIIVISPAESLGPLLDFSTERARKNLKLGYYDAIRIIKGLKGKKYYISNDTGENYFLDYFIGMSDEKIGRIAGLLGIEGSPGKRMLFEGILPKIAEVLNIPVGATYEELSLALLERLAEGLGIERFRIYDIKEFVSEIIKAQGEVPQNDFTNEIPGFLRRFEFISRALKEKMIGRLAGELFIKHP